MTHLLDTNICIYLIKKRPQIVVERLRSRSIEEIGISTITISELDHGVEKSASPEQNRIALVEFLTPFCILEYDQLAAYEYGRIRSRLEKEGQIIGPMDLLIAAHAVAENVILVTNNEKEFNRVSGIKTENWAI